MAVDVKALFAKKGEGANANSPEKEKKPAEGQIGAVSGVSEDAGRKRACVTSYEMHRMHQLETAAYREYQDNIKAAGALQIAIQKGIRAGEPLPRLLALAVECIGRMTGNSLFPAETIKDLQAIYGYGLGVPEPLEGQIQAISDRLTRLEAAYRAESDSDTRRRIKNAIKQHQADLDRIRKKKNE